MHTDASEVGLGGVLSQVRAGEEHPITYITRKLLANKNYSTVEKETLAIKWTLDKLRYYLLGREFTLVTDHAPLRWMAGAKDTNARVMRWFLAGCEVVPGGMRAWAGSKTTQGFVQW